MGLGKLRIEWDVLPGFLSPTRGRDIAMVHGFTGQLVFALIVATGMVLSKGTTTKPVPERRAGYERRGTGVLH